MDKLPEMTAAEIPLEIGGRTYRLSPLRAKDWAEAARRLAARRKSPLAIVREHLDGLDEKAQEKLLELAYRDERDGELLPMEMVQRWFATPEGGVFRFWRLLSRHHPEMTVDQAEELLRSAGVEAAGLFTPALDGLSEGNSCGRSAERMRNLSATGPTNEPGGVDPSLGDASFGG